MLLKVIFLSVVFTFGAAENEVTFKNVVVHGYSMFTHKFKKEVQSAASLKDVLPKDKVYDKIEIINNNIPVLYQHSISDLDLDEIVLENDEITKIQPGAFSKVPLLRKLVISKNKIEEILHGVFNNLNIATLDLSNNGITHIESNAFDNLTELLNINLADNLINQWNNQWFLETPLLTRVSFQNNLIEEIPARAFQNFAGEKKFGSLLLTINIILSHNNIKRIDKATFHGLSKINNLWLDYNEITTWDEDLLSKTTVQNLRLDHNKLTCFSGELEKIFTANTTHIDGNPWDCGCLKNIDLWATENEKDVIMYYSKLNCDAERIDRKIKELNERLKELKVNDAEEVDDQK